MSYFNCPINIWPKKWLREISDTFLTHFHSLTDFRQISVEFWRHFLFLLFYYLPTIILLSSGRHLREISEIFGTNIRAEYPIFSVRHKFHGGNHEGKSSGQSHKNMDSRNAHKCGFGNAHSLIRF